MIVKAIGISVITLVMCSVLKNNVPKIVPFIVFAAGICILIPYIKELGGAVEYFNDICDTCSFGDYFKVMLKGLGIAYLSCIGADMCRDCGENQLANRIELAAKTEILVLSLPLVKELIDLSESILI